MQNRLLLGRTPLVGFDALGSAGVIRLLLERSDSVRHREQKLGPRCRKPLTNIGHMPYINN